MISKFLWRILFRIGHVRYIEILTWLQGFQEKPLYLVVFSLYSSLLGIEGQRKLQQICNFVLESLRFMLEYLIYQMWPLAVYFTCQKMQFLVITSINFSFKIFKSNYMLSMPQCKIQLVIKINCQTYLWGKTI